MLSTELINLYNNIFALANYSAMLPVTLSTSFFAAIVSILFTLTAFIKHKNLVLETPSLATGSHVITESAFII